jgi:hypothetical protein
MQAGHEVLEQYHEIGQVEFDIFLLFLCLQGITEYVGLGQYERVCGNGIENRSRANNSHVSHEKRLNGVVASRVESTLSR